MLQIKFYKIHKALTISILLIFVQCLVVGPLSYAAPPEGKGNAGGNGNGNAVGQGGTPPGQEKSTPSTPASEKAATPDRGNSVEAKSERAAQPAQEKSTPVAERTTTSASENAATPSRGNSAEAKIDKEHPHQGRNTIDISDKGNPSAQGAEHRVKLAGLATHGLGRGNTHGVRGHEAAKEHVSDLLKSMNKFEHAKWNQNPKDTRGQGNMGKVDMRDPYGFDKDSGREKSERGRPIREEILNLAEIVNIDFGIMDTWIQYAMNYLEYLYYLQKNFNQPWNTALMTWVNDTISVWESWIRWIQSTYTYDRITVNDITGFGGTLSVIDYTLNLTAPEGVTGETLTITTSLTSMNDYKFFLYDWSTQQFTWVSYSAGQVVYSETDSVTLGTDSTYAFSYNPPDDFAGWNGGYFQLSVTVTEPDSGTTYTVTYDRDLYLYRCPYGIIYDKKSGKAITGATVTVHNADGSIAVLDKASNPNVTNPQTTDATGRYNCKLAISKKYYLTVKAPGYQEYKSDLFSERWHIVREDVGMAPLQLMAGK